MEKMVNLQLVLQMLSFEECNKLILNNGSYAARRMQVSRMRKGNFHLYWPDAKKVLVGLYEIQDTLKMAIEELEKEFRTTKDAVVVNRTD